eukprot:CAMPEP_0201968606 /NCGR_PEP_ID=MMETSP0904-20121228/15379_1 /ASSEMBLY_ACC=CAM_ASM_000553 /TAXON_ID=420261 /ORGANISM="Thalassiosira antarctica, Strain CCMP982" /LENGTH=120 /DNA_ID=CAMNT_0048516477 /DNA_START=147 /DNA_END=509 /DNA_ORIENTATION=+
MVIGSVDMMNKLATSMSMQIITHVVTLHLHIVAHLIKARGTDHVALAINLPGDGSILRAHLIVTGGTSGRASVVSNIRSHLAISDHTTDHIRVEVRFIIDNGEDLSMNTDIRGNVLSAKS